MASICINYILKREENCVRSNGNGWNSTEEKMGSWKIGGEKWMKLLLNAGGWLYSKNMVI